MGFAIGGATTVAETTQYALSAQVGNNLIQHSALYVVNGLTPGTNTFTLKFNNTGSSGTCSFSNYSITVLQQSENKLNWKGHGTPAGVPCFFLSPPGSRHMRC